jgi:hypothetical protein
MTLLKDLIEQQLLQQCETLRAQFPGQSAEATSTQQAINDSIRAATNPVSLSVVIETHLDDSGVIAERRRSNKVKDS